MGNFGGVPTPIFRQRIVPLRQRRMLRVYIPPVELGAESEVIGLPSITVYNRVVKRVARGPHCGPPCCLEWPAFEI